MVVPLQTKSGAFLARQAAKYAADSAYQLSRMKKLPGLANGITSVLKRNAYLQGEVATPIQEFAKRIPGKGSTAVKFGAAAGTVGMLLAVGGAAFVIAKIALLQSQINSSSFKNFDYLNSEVQKAFDRYQKNVIAIRSVEAQVKQFKQEDQRTRDRIYSLEKEQPKIRENANNALYETRQGRKIIEKQIEDTRRLIADVRVNIDTLKTRTSDAIDTAKRAFIKIEQIPKPLNGKDGKDGIPGKPGRDGKDGKDGIPGKPGRDGITKTITLPGTPGTPGKQGERGLSGIPGKDGKDGKNGKDGKDVDEKFIKELDRKLGDFPKLIAAIPKPLTYDQTVDAAATGTCRTTQPGGCTNRLVNNAANNINQNTNNGFANLLSKLSDTANLTLLPIIHNTTQTINATLGAPIAKLGGGTTTLTNFVSESFTRTFKFFNWAVLDRVLNLIILATTIHNAAMLSNNIGQTLLSIIGNILETFGIKDSDGKAYDVGDIIGRTIENLIKNLIGVDNYTVLSKGWKKANRIYQASANILNTLSSMFDSLYSILNVIGNRISRIGNALRWSGTVADNTYSWMQENNGFNNPVIVKMTEFSEKVDTLDMVSADVLNVKQQGTELKNNKAEFEKAIKGDEDKENKKETTERDKIKIPESTLTDVE